MKRTRISRVAVAVLACLAVLVASSVTYDSVESAAAQSAYPAPGAYATLASGHRVHYLCAGVGKPELVLFAGFGGDVLDWTPIVPALAQSRRVCAFDRLGQGWSDQPDMSGSSFEAFADQMHEAITIAGIDRPIVVGHSLGGALAQIYAAKYDVAGLILVDGLTAGIADAVLERLGTYQSLAPIARVGLMRPIAGMMIDPAYPMPVREEMFALRARASALGAVAQEGAVAAKTAGLQLRLAEESLRSGQVPVLVIAAGATDVPQLPPGAFVYAQRDFADAVPGATFVVIADARHYVMAERPEVLTGVMETWLW